MRRLSGVGWFGLDDGDDDDDWDDDCDDDDDHHDGDGDGKSDGDFWGNGRSKKMFGRLGGKHVGYPMRSRHGSPHVARVYIPGTGEQISIIFKSDHQNTRKGFDAVYRVSQGQFF